MNEIAIDRPASPKAAWICLGIAWTLFLLPIPGSGLFVGLPLNIVGFVLAIVVMAKGNTTGGLVPLLASLIASPIIYLIGLAIGAFMIISAPLASRTATTQAAEASVSVDAARLFADYNAGEALADGKYKGRSLAVTGKVASIQTGTGDAAYVAIDAGVPSMTIRAHGISDQVATTLMKGAALQLECRGAGMVDGSPKLEDCKVR